MKRAGRHGGDEPLALDDERAIAELRGRLLEADYTGPGVIQALGGETDTVSLHPTDIPVNARRLTPGSPLSTLIALFLLGLTVEPEPARQAFAPLSLDRLDRLGLVESTAEGIRALVELFPYQNLILACDRKAELTAGHETLQVVGGVTVSTQVLANLTVRRRVRTALDVGTGCGIQALLAARHSEHVIGVDINPRALNFAAFNARLNGISNVEWRQGNLFEPVTGCSFELIVCNPPYVISPDIKWLVRDSPLPGDTLCQQIVRDAPTFLRQGGFAQIVVSWIFPPGEEWSDRLRGWVAGTQSDAWLLHYNNADALSYAADAIRPMQLRDFARYPQNLDRWLEYYRKSGIDRLATGMISLRRRSNAKNWTRADQLPDPIRPASDHVLRVFNTQDYLAELPDDRGLLDTALALVDDHSLQQLLVCRDGTWQTRERTLTLQSGLHYEGTIDGSTAYLLSRLDGQRTLGQILEEAARSQSIEGQALERFMTSALRGMRVLLELGFLVTSGRSTPPAAV